MWIKGGADVGNYAAILKKYGSNVGYAVLNNTTDKIYIEIYNGVAWGVDRIAAVFSEFSVITDQMWRHYAFTFDQINIRGYENGIQGTPVPWTIAAGVNTDPLYISPPVRFSGSVAEVRIYNRALSASEIQRQYLQYLAFDSYKEV